MDDGPRKTYGYGYGREAAYQPGRCAKQVYSNDRAAIFYQCHRKNGHGPKGLWCKQHNPDRVAEARKAEEDARLKQQAEESEILRTAERLAKRIGGGEAHYAHGWSNRIGRYTRHLVITFEQAERFAELLERKK